MSCHNHLKKPHLLLHACCAPCLTASILEVIEDFDVTAYFFNPNIHPLEEYQKRKDEFANFCQKMGYHYVIETGKETLWETACTPLKNEKEGGERCKKCFEIRLLQTAKYAKEKDYDYFCTTLTISPHKNADLINKIGKNVENIISKTENTLQTFDKIEKPKFLIKNFKKKDGFKKSLQISKEYGLFRQTYCGCRFSIRKISV